MAVCHNPYERAQIMGGLVHFLCCEQRLPLVRGAAWALSGCLYGLVFVLISGWLPLNGYPHVRLVAAVVATTAFVALLYGSMRLTVIAAIYTSAAVIAAFLLADGAVSMQPLALAGGSTGALVGMVFGWRVKSSRVSRADAKIIAGTTAGLLASGALLTPSLLGVPLPLPLALLLAAPLSGLLFIGLASRCVCRFSDVLPAPLDGAVVGTGVGLLMSALFWLMTGTLEGYLHPEDQALAELIRTQLPVAVLAATLGTFSVGVARALLKIQWVDL